MAQVLWKQIGQIHVAYLTTPVKKRKRDDNILGFDDPIAWGMCRSRFELLPISLAGSTLDAYHFQTLQIQY